MTFIAAVMCGAGHGPLCEFALAIYLPRPLGDPLDEVITRLVSEELLCSLLPSPPHKSYFLSYLAPIARVPEGILGFWRISSPSPFTKQGWSPFASVRGAWASRLSPGLSGQQCGPCLGYGNRFYPERVGSPRHCLAASHCHHVLCSRPVRSYLLVCDSGVRVSEAGINFLCCVSLVLHQWASDCGLWVV